MRIAVVVLLLTGCASPITLLKLESPVTVGNANFVIKHSGRFERDVPNVARALERVPKSLEPWGALPGPVTIYVVDSHGDLEAAARQYGTGWIRAWAFYDEMILQAPTTWGATQERIDELVLHEVTHCLLFERSATSTNWREREIPLWFREGMAIFTAREQRHYPSLEDSARWLDAHPDTELFTDGEDVARKSSIEVYGVSLHAFAFLLDAFGTEKIRAVMQAMHEDVRFDAAFEAMIGKTVTQFVGEFRTFLRTRAFREKHKTIPIK